MLIYPLALELKPEDWRIREWAMAELTTATYEHVEQSGEELWKLENRHVCHMVKICVKAGL